MGAGFCGFCGFCAVVGSRIGKRDTTGVIWKSITGGRGPCNVDAASRFYVMILRFISSTFVSIWYLSQ